MNNYTYSYADAVGWVNRIHCLHHCSRVRLPPCNDCSGYHTKQSDGEVSVMLGLWGMQTTLSSPSLPDPPWPGVVAPDIVLPMGQIEINFLLILNWIVWSRTVYLYTNWFDNK